VNVAYHFTCIANDRIELWANFNRGEPMTLYQGEVEKYTLSISDPSRPTNWKNWIALEGSFGVAFLYFVPPGGSLRPNKKRAAFNTFDIDYWMSSYPLFIDMLRNEKPVYFLYDDSSNRAEVATNWEPVGEAEPLTA
jgi:hypothetical protein